MENYNEDVFLSEPFVLKNGESKVVSYISQSRLRNRISFNRKNGAMEAYKDNHGIYRLPEACRQRGITIKGEHSMNPAGQGCTIYRFAPGRDPEEKDFKLLASLRK
jgi:hypothetical protein